MASKSSAYSSSRKGSSISSFIRRHRAPIHLALLLTAVVTAVVAACGGDDPDPPALATVAIATTTPPPSTSATAIVPATQAVPTPSGPAPGGANDETVAFGASDGPILRGHLYSVPGPKRRIVIFASPDQAAWRSQAIGMVG